MFLDALIDAILDSIKLLPFLFLTYLLMEIIENRTSDHTKQILRQSGKMGPIFGGLLGAFPQCGFSAAAANLYAGRVVTMGTLLAVFLSTSDEMLPVFLSESVAVSTILKILGLKVLIGIAAGFLIDLTVNRREFWLTMKRKGDPRKNNPFEIKKLCEQEQCHCSSGIWVSTITHTVQVFFFILLISLILNLGITAIGEEELKQFILNKPVIGEILAGLIGLIPNCAASVVLAQLYLEGAMNFGALMSGLLVGAGVGILVLLRVNKSVKQNARIILLLYGIGVICGILIELLKIGELLGI